MPKVMALNNKTCKYEPVSWVDMRYVKPRISNRKHSYTKHNSGMGAVKYLIYIMGVLFLISAVDSLIK